MHRDPAGPLDRLPILLAGLLIAGSAGCSYFDHVPVEVLKTAVKIEFNEDLPAEVTQKGTSAISPDLSMSGFNAVATASWKRGGEEIRREFLRLKSGQWTLRVNSVPLVIEPDGSISARPIGCKGVFERAAGIAGETADPTETAAVRVELEEKNSACSGRYEIGGGQIDSGEIVLLYSFESPLPAMKKSAGQQYILLRSKKNPEKLLGGDREDVTVSTEGLSIGKRFFFPGTEFPAEKNLKLVRVK